jgi:hypothetical protein
LRKNNLCNYTSYHQPTIQKELEACWADDKRRQNEWEAECDECHQISKEVKNKIFEIKAKELNASRDKVRRM